MNWVDTVVTALIAVNVFNGLRQGFIRSFFDFSALITAIFFAIKGFPYGYKILTQYLFMPEAIANILSFALFWAVIYCVVSYFGNALHRALREDHGISGINTFMGALFGLVKGVCFAAVIFIPLMYFPLLPKELSMSLEESILLKTGKPYVLRWVPALSDFVYKKMPSKKEAEQYLNETQNRNVTVSIPISKIKPAFIPKSQ
jgi:uncharacterized membrane protein required for colicin V production